VTITAPLAFVQARSTWSVVAPSRVAISFSGASNGPLGSLVSGLQPHISRVYVMQHKIFLLERAVCLNDNVMFSGILHYRCLLHVNIGMKKNLY
jgi:hypothetical protein